MVAGTPASRSAHLQHDLPEAVVARHPAVRVGDLIEWENGVDDRMHPPLREPGQDVSRERRGGGDLLVERARSEHRPPHGEAAGEDAPEVERRGTSPDESDEHQTTSERE